MTIIDSVCLMAEGHHLLVVLYPGPGVCVYMHAFMCVFVYVCVCVCVIITIKTNKCHCRHTSQCCP